MPKPPPPQPTPIEVAVDHVLRHEEIGPVVSERLANGWTLLAVSPDTRMGFILIWRK